HDILRAGTDQVGEHLTTAGAHHSALRHGQDQVLPLGAVALTALTLTPVGSAAVGTVVILQQRGHLRVDAQDDVPAPPPVAAVRAAQRLELLAVHRGHTMAAVARGQVQHDTVDEGSHGLILSGAEPVGRHQKRRWLLEGNAPASGVCAISPQAGWSAACSAALSAATMLTTLRPPLAPNCTVPAVSANRVSSLPRPTPSPGWNLVPR